jgi:SAM-dependent methyltransferase
MPTYQEMMANYSRSYFEDGTTGYSLYRDFPVHWKTFRLVMDRKPASVLELGAAYGFQVKRFNDAGVPSWGAEISPHCWHRRVTPNLKIADATEGLPFRDGEFDLVTSTAFMEHIPEDRLPRLVNEMQRVARRGLHGISFSDTIPAGDHDVTHFNLKPRSWWVGHLPPTHEVMDKEDMEKPPFPLPGPDGKLKLNVGCFLNMFDYGWTNVDILDMSPVARAEGRLFYHLDASLGLPYADGTVDLVYASHFLEHLTYDKGLAFLKECHRIMKKDAVIRIAVPDAEMLTRLYLGERFDTEIVGTLVEFDDLNPGCAKAKTPAGKLYELLLGGGHQAIYDATTLADAIKTAGFRVETSRFAKSVSKQMEVETCDFLPTISLFMEGVK